MLTCFYSAISTVYTIVFHFNQTVTYRGECYCSIIHFICYTRRINILSLCIHQEISVAVSFKATLIYCRYTVCSVLCEQRCHTVDTNAGPLSTTHQYELWEMMTYSSHRGTYSIYICLRGPPLPGAALTETHFCSVILGYVHYSWKSIQRSLGTLRGDLGGVMSNVTKMLELSCL